MCDHDPVSEADIRAAIDHFALSRAKAINTYAGMEQSLAFLFETLLGTEIGKAFVAFAAIRDHLTVIKKLLELSHGTKYDTFYKSLREQLSGVTGARNKIVHWILVSGRTGGKPFDVNRDIFLAQHPNMFAKGRFRLRDVEEFQQRAEFYRLLIFYFSMHLKHGDGMPVAPHMIPWCDVYKKPIIYPPEPNHPLA